MSKSLTKEWTKECILFLILTVSLISADFTTSSTSPEETTTSSVCGDITIGDDVTNYRKGQVILNYPGSGTVICPSGVGVNEAKVLCRMSCNSSGDMYALPILYNSGYYTGPGNALFGLHCTGSESHIRQCTYVAVYDKLYCFNYRSLAVSCNPIPTDPQISAPIVSAICQNGMGNVVLSKLVDSTLSSQSVVLNDSLSSCNPQFNDDGQFLYISFQFDSCDPIVQVNNTHISYTTTILKIHSSVSLVPVVDYAFDVTCTQPKSGIASGDLNVQNSQSLVQNTSFNFMNSIMIYRTPYFEQPVIWPETALTGQTLYAVVSLVTGISQIRLFLGKCWATAENDENSSVSNVFIIDKCTQDNSQIFPYNDTTVMFSFKAVDFVNATSNQPIFLWCDTFTCAKTEQSNYCSQVCGTPMPSFLTRKRRSTSNNFSVRSTPLRIQKRKR